ncbi:hypothetical protein KUTeg_008004 [Tegillarca granosa]|uniref:Chorein N-terminal domain-containing protein n=1 Tax=Tegillarca granosa TaxID=220873 RepID=A0ABQ9FEY0_TEGGR|nr:hypothetical protein KUTeg_008004 [Tegillarca granosa]
MLEGLAAWVLNTYVGEYVEDLNTAQLSIALLQGFIGKIKLQIPVSRLRSEPWVISIEKLYLVAGPIKHVQYDEEKEKQAEQKRKASMLEALENKWKLHKQEKQEGYGSSWFSYGTSMAANILENLQLKIKNVHIRYEDSELIPSCPFAFGITIKSLSAQSTDGSWKTKFVNRDDTDMMHKLVDLQDFSVYLDTNATMLSGLSYTDLSSDVLIDDLFYKMMYMITWKEKCIYVKPQTSLRKNTKDLLSYPLGLLSFQIVFFKDHGYLLAPISAQTKLKRNTSALPLRSPDLPRIHLEMNLEKMTVQLSEDQYRIIIQWLKELERFECRRKYKKWHPVCSVKKSPRKWWKFAINTNLHIIHEKQKKKTKEYMTERVKDVILYHKIYTQYLMTSILDSTMTVCLSYYIYNID